MERAYEFPWIKRQLIPPRHSIFFHFSRPRYKISDLLELASRKKCNPVVVVNSRSSRTEFCERVGLYHFISSNLTPSRRRGRVSLRKDAAKCEKRMPRIISALTCCRRWGRGETAWPSAAAAIYDRSVKFWLRWEFVSQGRRARESSRKTDLTELRDRVSMNTAFKE